MKRKICLIISFIMLVTLCFGCKGQKESYKDSENRIDDKYGTCYQVFIYSFCDSDGDGIGDINGLISKLDYIEDLGFTSIWLLPFNQSTTYHKYDVVDYYSIDKQYGTMEDFEKLVSECDARNIDIYMDFVINHTSSKNEWFITASDYIKSLKYGEEPDYTVCPEAEYYNFVQADYCPSGYAKLNGTTNWYYECVFWDQMPDLNFDCDAVRKNIEEIASFWIDKGIKGFRLDAALHYYDNSQQKSVDTLKWFCDYVESINPDIYCVAEVWSNYATLQKFYESGIDSLFNFTLGSQNGLFVKSVNKAGDGETGINLATSLINVQDKFSSINPNYVDGVFLSNHDTGRAAGFLGRVDEKVKLAAGIEILSTGCVFVYYGDELGMSGSGDDVNKRAPMYWTDDTASTDMTAGPPGMVQPTHEFGSYETQKDDEYSVYNYYKKAIHLRNKYPEIGRGKLTAMEDIMNKDGNVCALSKEYDGKTIYVIYNINSEPTTINVSKNTYNYTQIADYLTVGEEKPSLAEDNLTIPAYGCVILN